MTVIKLKSGVLWVHAPIAPTKECIQVRDWVDRIAKDWPFKKIIPAHFAAPINAGRSDFLAAFAFLDELLGECFVTRPSLSLLFASFMGRASSFFPPDDMKTLSSLDQFLVSVGAVKKTISGRKW